MPPKTAVQVFASQPVILRRGSEVAPLRMASGAGSLSVFESVVMTSSM